MFHDNWICNKIHLKSHLKNHDTMTIQNLTNLDNCGEGSTHKKFITYVPIFGIVDVVYGMVHPWEHIQSYECWGLID